MDDREIRARIAGAIEEAWGGGCPVAGPDHTSEMAKTAIRRWRSFGRRCKLKQPTLDDQIEDLAKGLRDYLEADRRLVGPLMKEYRCLARRLADTLIQLKHLDGAP